MSFCLRTLFAAAAFAAPFANAADVPDYVKAGPAPGRVPVAKLYGGELGVERVASAVGTPAPYLVKGHEQLWTQVDLGKSFPIEAVKLFSFAKDKIAGKPDGVSPDGFPKRFRIEASDTPDFANPHIIADHTAADFQLPFGHMPVLTFRANTAARYIRLNVTQAADKTLLLWRFEVISGGQDVATGKTLSDSVNGDLGHHVLLRPRRPVGDGVVLDNPANATDPATWRPVRAPLRTPREGVTIGGLFKQSFDRNTHYLLNSFSARDCVRNFLQRAGKDPGAADRKRSDNDFWTAILGGSNAGRFLMGAGNALRWSEHAELRQRLNYVVDAIEENARPDGYIMGYPEERTLVDQTNGYCRSWLTNGLIEAGISGNPKAFPLLRRWGDWFNTSPYLPEMAMRVAIGWQGMIANSRTYVDTPVGTPADIQVLQRYFQLNYWLEQLAQRNPDALWKFQYDRTHSYLVVTLNAYADMYIATGDVRYLEAVRGAWEMIRSDFMHTGGGITLIESYALMARQDPPNARLLRVSNNELCGNVFYTMLSQQLHLLFPDEERYPAEMEKSIYNVALANQEHDGKIRYHARLVRKKENGSNSATCCEGQGTRLFGALPEFIYKIAADGIYVDLFNESTITWEQSGQKISLAQNTEFPAKPEVTLKLAIPEQKTAAFKLRVRVPFWATKDMRIAVNGQDVTSGTPGTYVTLDRVWHDGDVLSFVLPMGFRLTKYSGVEKGFSGQETYALEYGPLLMAFTGKIEKDITKKLPLKAADLIGKLRPVEGKPLHFRIEGLEEYEYMPYYEVQREDYTCFPFFE